MKKLPLRRKLNGKHNGLDELMTPAQVCAVAKEHGIEITENALALDRRDGKGPPYIKKGNRVLYPPRSSAAIIESRKPRLINPADRMKEAS